ncbi:Uma2 family endonuclease [Iningainema tapete]|uniref:Uma2 family endonuclease n=1 Tax=Iningainema tapete BLCC-T55 TaxID=2748662 RepID=A0A8J6XVJ1_9CYAN|nr:Uma2 family endonuclease [Iningainema tapete]MBD2778596.1 Uma2 family endonuclease [Iningainema tapete BLCC-T55]
MSVDVTMATNPQIAEDLEWEPPMPPTDLIFDDGEPLESNRHRIAMNVLIRSMLQAYADRNDFFTSGNMFVYYSSTQARNRDFKGPDFFVALNVDGTKERLGWVIWEEDGRYPDVIVELLSPSTAVFDKGKKKDIYEQVFRTPDYFVYDPFNPDSLQGWHLDLSSGYQPLELNEQGWLWCQSLGLWLGTWQGTIDRETALWLRFYDGEGNLVLLPEEAAQAKAQQAQQEAQQAQQEAQQAQQEAQQAQQEAQRERQRAELLASRLREMGVDPNTL